MNVGVQHGHLLRGPWMRPLAALAAIAACASALAAAAIPAGDSLVVLTSSDLPIIIIDTHGQEIPNEPKITADMRIVDNGPGVRNSVAGPFNAYAGKIGIEIRGSSSVQFPKKQFAVETRDSSGGDLDVALLGMPAETDWVLSAPYNDKSLIRDAVVYTLTRRMGRYASRSRFCELVLNGQYAGVYVLFEKIKRDKGRVNIAKCDPPDSTGDAVTGGYIIKIDKTDGAETAGWYSGFLPFVGAAYRVLYQYHYPKAEDLVWPQRGYITRFVRDFELAMYLPTFNDPVNGYDRWLDSDAFIDYVLINELSKNVDGYRLSTFLYKDRDSRGGKLVLGPVWDYNLGFGNSNYHRGAAPDGFQIAYMSDSAAFRKNEPFLGPFWWKKIFDDPPFRARLRQRWTSLRAGEFSTGRITGLVDSLVAVLAEAAPRNFRRWTVLGQYIWPNPYVGQTYGDEIRYMKEWIVARVTWLDRELSLTAAHGDDGAHVPVAASLGQNYPNPFNPGTTIPFTVGSAAHVSIGVFDLLGREVSRLLDADRPPGDHAVVFDGSGLASGMYVCRMTVTPSAGAAVRPVSSLSQRLLLMR